MDDSQDHEKYFQEMLERWYSHDPGDVFLEVCTSIMRGLNSMSAAAQIIAIDSSAKTLKLSILEQAHSDDASLQSRINHILKEIQAIHELIEVTSTYIHTIKKQR